MKHKILGRPLERPPGRSGSPSRATWGAWLALGILVVGAGILALSLRTEDRAAFREEIEVAGEGITTDLRHELGAELGAIDRLAGRWDRWGEDSARGRRADVRSYFEDLFALEALATSPDGRTVDWSADSGGGRTAEVDRLAVEGFPDLQHARRHGGTTVGPVVRAEDGTVLLPVYSLREPPAMLIALFDVERLLDAALGDHLVAGYATDISLGSTTIYHRGDPAGFVPPDDWAWEHPVEITGVPWTVRVWPRADRIRTKRSWLPGATFGAGVLLAAALGVSIRSTGLAQSQARELEAAKRELERSNADLQQFAYVASHDLQEPLRMVSSYISLIDRRYRERLDEDGREFMAFAVDGAHRMQRLINDLLVYSRISQNELSLTEVDPDRVLTETLTALQTSIEERAALVTRDSLPAVLSDPDQLSLLFQNLLTNALKFSGEAPPRIHVSGEHRGDRVRLSVTDHGIGISPEGRDRIFTIFQRLHARDEYPGTGIGLAVVKRIVERHDGEVSVESTPGRGSTFSFTLPAASQGAPA